MKCMGRLIKVVNSCQFYMKLNGAIKAYKDINIHAVKTFSCYALHINYKHYHREIADLIRHIANHDLFKYFRFLSRFCQLVMQTLRVLQACVQKCLAFSYLTLSEKTYFQIYIYVEQLEILLYNKFCLTFTKILSDLDK